MCQLPSTLTSDEDSFNSRSLPDMREFLFLLLSWGGGGVEFLEFDTRFSGGKKSLLCIFFNMSSIKDPSISVFTGIGLFLFLFLPALILPNSNCLHKILFVKEGIKIF